MPPATPTSGEGEWREEGLEGLRVAQVATILNNLSTSDTSAAILAESHEVLR